MTPFDPVTYPRRINIGCGYDKRAGYLNVDVDPKCKPDLLLPDHDLSTLPANFFEEVLAWDVLEHIPHTYTMSALLDWAALLQSDGILVMQTSSVFGVVDCMRSSPSFETEYNWMKCLFGNQGHAGDFHHIGFTDRTLRAHLYNAGLRFSSFDFADGWLMQCRATKRQDWTTFLEKPVGDAIKEIGLKFLHRNLPAEFVDSCLSEIENGANPRNIIKSLIGSPEALYKAGKILDDDPSLASL